LLSAFSIILVANRGTLSAMMAGLAWALALPIAPPTPSSLSLLRLYPCDHYIVRTEWISRTRVAILPFPHDIELTEPVEVQDYHRRIDPIGGACAILVILAKSFIAGY
jgi:hypothetical protein